MDRKIEVATMLVILLCALGAGGALAQVAPPFQMKWGTHGIGDGEFMGPHGLAYSPSGHVYVSEFWGHRVQKFTSDGVFVLKWGELGGGEGQFNSPGGIAVDAAGDVYVTSFYSHNVQKFTADGTFITRWGTNGTGDGEFRNPFGITVDAAGDVYVADALNGRIQKFTGDGTFLMAFGSMGEVQGVAVDAMGFVYATDAANHVVNKYASDGTLVASWGGFGSGDGQFWTPSGILVDAASVVYVSEINNHRVQMFSTSGVYYDQWGTYGTGDGQFDSPQGLAAHTNGSIYVADSRNDRIQVFGHVPVPVALAYFHVTRVDAGALLSWGTNDAVPDRAAFDVYRGVAGKPLVRVTAEPLAAGQANEFLDAAAPPQRVEYWVEEIDAGGGRFMHGPAVLDAAATAALSVGPNSPNPFNPGTTIHYGVAQTGRARLAVYDARGRLIRVLADETLPSGSHEAYWDGRDRTGRAVASGVYFARVEQGGRHRTHKLLLLK